MSSTDTTFKTGDKVKFKAGPRSTGLTIATITGTENGYLVTKDAEGVERKTRPGSCTKV